MNQLKQRINKKKLEQELQLKNGKIVIDESSCDGCGSCLETCPHSALTLKILSEEEIQNLSFKGRLKVKIKGNKKAYVSNYDLCTACGLCIKQCHEFAIYKIKKD